MAKFSVIPKSGGSPKCSGTPSFTGTYMKPGMLEFRELASPYPVAWEIGDYVAYSRTGLTYRLYSIPQIKKQARNQSYGGAYIYQGVQFYDDSKQLEICPFRDLVAGDNRIHFSTQPSISTFEAVDGIARRLQACLDDMYPDTWLVRLATAQMGAPQDLLDLMAEPRDFTVSGVSLLGALEKVYEVWPEVDWVFTREQVTVGGATVWRNVLTIGGGGLSSTQSYLYGKGNGLKSITRTVANADEFANRIFAYGSQRNMLPRWYNDMLIKDADSLDIQNLMLPVAAIPSLRWSGWGLTEVDGAMLPDAAKAYVEDGDSVLRLGLRPKSIYFDGSGEYPEIYPTIRNMTIGEIRALINERVVSPEWVPSPSYDNADRIDMVLSVPTVFDPGLSGENGRAADVSASETLGSLSGSGNVAAGGNASTILAMRTYTMTKTCPTDLSVSVAGNGTVTLQGAGYAHLAVSIQKGDGTTFAEVKRQMFELEESASGVFQLRSVIVKAPDVSVSNGETVRIYVSLFITNTDGSASLSYSYAVSPGLNFAAAWSRKKTFTITIRQCGFDIGAQAALGDGKTISMRTGKCAGRSFAINSVQYDADTDSWVLECFRSEDESLSQWFPNTDYPIEADDEFVLLDIAMPELYIIVAERRLLQAARELLADTATERWQYVPEIDAKFMVETGRTIVAGQNMSIADLDIIGESPVSVLVDSLTINEGEAVIPTYKVTLRDRKKKTWTESNPPEPISSKPVSTVTQQSLQAESTSGGGESFFTLDENGNVTLRPQYQNMWVPGWLASGGIGQSSSGGGTDLNRVWESLTNNTDFPNEKINLAHIPDVPYTQVTGLDSWVAGKGYAPASSVPTALSQLTDDSTHRLVTDAQISEWTNKTGNVQADWNATTGLAAILNKPSLSAVATSGSYNDLSNKPSIPNESTVAGWGFTKNAGTVTSVGLTVPTGLSVLGSPVTASGTLAISFANGYSIPTTAKQSGWDAKYDKPAGGIPATDLASAVQTSLGKADTALQSEADPVYSAWIGTSRTKNTVFAAPSNANGTPSFRALVASDIPSLTISKISDAETWISGKGYAPASDLTTLAGRVTSIEDWFEIETVNGQSTLHVKQGRALYSDSWIASGGIGSGSSGGSSVTWGTKSGYTRPLTVEGVTETLLLDGALTGYATTSAMDTALAGKQDSLAFTLQGTSGVTYNLANALYGAVLSSNADIGTTYTTIATVAGIEIKAKITHQSLSGYALAAGDPDYNFEVGSLIIGDGALTIGNDYHPVWQYPGTDPSTFPPTPITVSKSLAYLDEVVLLSGSQTISGTKSFRGSINGGTSLQPNKWSITNAGAATFASLIVGGDAVVPTDYVTITGAQTISGAKTFSAQLTASSGIALGGSILPNSDSSVNFGDSSHRFAGGNIRNLYVTNQTFVDGTTPSITYGGIYCGDGLMQWQLGANAAGGFLTFGQTTGFFHNGNGAVPLGRSDHGWGNIYIANNKALTSADTNGNSREILKLANNDWLYIGNNGITSVQLNATGYIKMYWDSGDAFASFGAGANAYFPNLIPNGTSGTKNLGSFSERWGTVYGVDTNLSGNITLSRTSHIDFGEGRIEYDTANHAFHFTRASGNNDVGIYADGFVASGGIGSGNASVKYVTCTQVEYNAMTKDPATLYLIGSPISKVCLGSITLYSET